MSIIEQVKEEIKVAINSLGYSLDRVNLQVSSRKDLGEYQINDAMSLAKSCGKNPVEVAKEIISELEKDPKFINLNIAGPGFINLSFSNEFLINSLSSISKDIYNNIDKEQEKTIFMDYGGANLAKTLHVGHLRPANIGEGVKNLARTLGHKVIADVHFGDIGRQSGMIISELKLRMPDNEFFNPNYDGDYNDLELPITEEDLEEIYPTASKKASSDDERMAEVVQITKEVEEGHPSYSVLWDKIKELSKADVKKLYDRMNINFDLYEGETECYPFIPDMIKSMEEKGLLYESEGAKIIDVEEETDNKPMPPLMVIKSNGATIYATRDLATLLSREERFDIDEYWYFTDIRQSLYFEQVFRAAHKANIVKENTILEHFGNGTINSADGTPFKTRDGGVMSLKELIKQITEETSKRINRSIVEESKVAETAEMISIASLKYADYLAFRGTDYNFDVSKFSDLEGKTAPYLLYSTIRMKSLLEKSKDLKQDNVVEIEGTDDKEVILTLLQLPTVLTKSLEIKSVNEIADYLYKLTNTYNKFYSNNKIILCENKSLQETWLVLTKAIYEANLLLLKILGIKVPEKM